MAGITTQIRRFLKKADVSYDEAVEMVPKSDSAGEPGNILFFNYRGRPGGQAVLLVKPISRDAKTGNQLLTCVNISIGDYNTISDLEELYNDRESLGSDQYRTYIMSKISGPLRRINF